MSIEPGDYYLYAYDLERRPIGPKSLSNIPTEVVVQSAGTEAHKWHIRELDGKYVLTFNSLMAVENDHRVVLVPPGPRIFFWNIIPSNRAPEPLYGIFVPDVADKAWFAPDGVPAVEVPVTILDPALAIAFERTYD